MLGSHLQLTADVIPNQLAEEILLGIQQKIIESDPRSNKDPLDPRKLLDLGDEMEIFIEGIGSLKNKLA